MGLVDTETGAPVPGPDLKAVRAKRVIDAARALLLELDLSDVDADFPDVPYDNEEPLRAALKAYDELA